MGRKSFHLEKLNETCSRGRVIRKEETTTPQWWFKDHWWCPYIYISFPNEFTVGPFFFPFSSSSLLLTITTVTHFRARSFIVLWFLSCVFFSLSLSLRLYKRQSWFEYDDGNHPFRWWWWETLIPSDWNQPKERDGRQPVPSENIFGEYGRVQHRFTRSDRKRAWTIF